MKRQRECRRLHDWDLRLQEYLRDALARPFAWGGHDCCLHVCNAVLAMTGVDLALGFRGKYATKAQGLALLKKRGGVEGVAESVAWHFRLEEVGVLFAGRGDIVLLDMPERGPALAIVDFDGLHALAAGPKGLERFTVRAARRAWRVPHA
jgi:hypothetical protein